MAEDLGIVLLRYALGYLLQVLPCAGLCLLPFVHSLKRPKRAVAVRACAAVFAACAVFVVVSLAVFDGLGRVRMFLSNLLFLVLLPVLLMLFWREVDASRPCKTFVFLVVMVLGCLIILANSALGTLLGFPDIYDARLYSLNKVATLALVDAVAFPAGCLLMLHVVEPLVRTCHDDRQWWRLCLIPVVILLLLVGAYWLPAQLASSYRAEVAVLVGVIIVGGAAVVFHYAGLARDLTRAAGERDSLAQRVDALERERREAREREANAVTFKTPSAVATFAVDDISYLEVFGHRLVIHLAGGGEEQLLFSLAQARELLPADRFIQCHRSYLVNKAAIRSLRRFEIALADGTAVPVSKQRYREVEEALDRSAGTE